MISVIIPNFNGENVLKDCLPLNMTLFKQLGIDNVIIVDDKSIDKSVDYITTHFPEITLIQNQEKLCFTKNCNIGAAIAKHDMLLFLNSDMVVTELDISHLQTYLTRPDIFAVSPQIFRETKTNKTYNEAITMGFFKSGWFSAEVYPNLETQVSDPEGMPLLWACGGALFTTKKHFDRVGGFDPIYEPFYVEDLDLCYKAWKRGLKSVYTVKASCQHRHQSTIGRLFSKSYVENTHLRNQFIFVWLNITSPTMLAQHLLTVLIMCLTFQFKQQRAIAQALGKLPLILQKRKNKPTEVLSDKQILQQWSSFVDPLLKSRQ